MADPAVPDPRAAALPWQEWARARPTPAVSHLDTAACGRASTAVLDAVARHARREAEVGGYVAEEEAGDALHAARATLGDLLGVGVDGVAFTDSGTAALLTLLRVWPLPPGPVAVTGTGWGPDRAAFAGHGRALLDLPAHPDGTADLDALQRLLRTAPPALVHLTQLAAHRALEQPVREVAHLCREAGVALWVDAAQALGQVAADCGADAVYATSRKWLCGPRGVGVLAVRAAWWPRLRGPAPLEVPPGLALDSGDANVAARVGLARAVQEYAAAGPARVHARLAQVGQQTRETLRDLPTWRVLDPPQAPGAITALRPRRGQDVLRTRARLLADHGILSTASLPWRAPGDMPAPLLRLSPHVDCTPAQLHAVREALGRE